MSTSKRTKDARGRATPISPDFSISDSVRAWAEKQGFTPYLQAHFDWFVDYAKARPTKVLYTDWDAAFRICIRSDWGDIRRDMMRAGVKPQQTQVPLMCGEIIGRGEKCGMPGKPRSGNDIRCDHHERLHQDRTKAPMPAHARAAVDSILKRPKVHA